MCVLNTKKLVVANSVTFGGTPSEGPRNIPKSHAQREVLEMFLGRQLKTKS